MSTTRRLAAILAADVAGYSRLMAADEVGTLAALKAVRREVVDPAIAEHNGRIVKTTGDGMLVEFASAVDAVTCAMSVQEKMAARGDDITFRIGINVGDIIIDGDDIFGDGVNVAARVENECAPGRVYLSAQAFDQVRNKTAFSFENLGERQLKNIDRLIGLFAIAIAGPSSVQPENAKQLSLPDKPSIAVLPFQNMSGDPEQEYFADGMVEDIITALSRFKSLFVIARNSSFTYKGKTVDIRQVGRELGVRYVLEGSVRKAGDRVRITGQLIEAGSGTHLWADRVDGALADIFELQDGITERVVGAIAPRVKAEEIKRTKLKRPENLDAYDWVLRAQALLTKNRASDIPEALSHLERAVAADPNYALAHALTAYSFAMRYVAGANTDLAAERSRSIAAARRALELAGDDPECLFFSGFALGNFEGGITVIAERCVGLNPNLAMGWFLLGSDKLYQADYAGALECQARALRLSPLGTSRVGIMSSISLAHLLSDEFKLAYDWAERAYQENENSPFAQRVLAMSAARVGNRARAHAVFQLFAPAASQYLERMRSMMALNIGGFEKVADALRLASTPE